LTKKLISIVVPIFQEEKILRQLVERLDVVTETLPEFDWRYVLTNDGSPDSTWKLIKKLANESSKVVGIDLSRNFGKEIALTAGVHQAEGADAVICIDADLQHPPELIPQMVSKWQGGAEMVIGLRASTDNKPFWRETGSRVFYWVMSRFSDLSITRETTDFGLYDHKVVDAFCRTTERGRVFRAIMIWVGFKREYIEFEADARAGGKIAYSPRKLWQLAINSITHFSLWPLKIVGYFGLAITFCSGLLIVRMIFNHLLNDEIIFTPLAIVVVANTFLIGIVLIAIGMLALYVGAIHTETINRPLYLIRETVGSGFTR
jgi:dolichol-phosphate mannosyltransferase